MSKRVKEPERIYVDKSGVKTIPYNFIDVIDHKTVNFELDKYVISISHFGVTDAVGHIKKISNLHAMLLDQMNYQPNNELDGIANSIRTLKIVDQISLFIYKLSRKVVKNKRGYKKALLKKARSDVGFILEVVEQVLNYWQYLKKKALFLAQGKTLLMTVGDIYTWSTLEMDSQGKILARPR